MLVTTVAVAEGTAVVVVTLRRRRDDAAPAAQAPVHTAMTMMVMQIPMQQSGTTAAMTIPMITAVVKIEVLISVERVEKEYSIISDERGQ